MFGIIIFGFIYFIVFYVALWANEGEETQVFGDRTILFYCLYLHVNISRRIYIFAGLVFTVCTICFVFKLINKLNYFGIIVVRMNKR